MISSHFDSIYMKREARLAAAILLVTLCGLCGLQSIRAQSDSPITISDGSLTIESAVPWTRFRNPDGRTKTHPDANRAVTRVAITMPGHNQTINFSGQRCTVAVRYASTDLMVTTGNNGKGLRVVTDFSSFQRGVSDNHLVHRNRNAKISHVTVTQGTQVVFNNAASGGTQIVISYQ
jgi:hypothetical protein